MKLPYKPRWLNKLYANINCLFWLPCPICGEKFGGHEWSETLKTTPMRGVGTCTLCVDEAIRRNEIWYKEYGDIERNMEVR